MSELTVFPGTEPHVLKLVNVIRPMLTPAQWEFFLEQFDAVCAERRAEICEELRAKIRSQKRIKLRGTSGNDK